MIDLQLLSASKSLWFLERRNARASPRPAVAAREEKRREKKGQLDDGHRATTGHENGGGSSSSHLFIRAKFAASLRLTKSSYKIPTLSTGKEPTMNTLVRYSCLIIVLLPALAAASDDQQKAQKLLNKITAMAADPTGKRAVSLAMSDTLAVGRAELAQRRHAMDLNYGELFVAYQLVRGGQKIDDIAAWMKSGKRIWQIADEQHVDWKQIASDAKKLNSRVDNNLLKHFGNGKAAAQRDVADGYDPFLDSVRSDTNVSQQEIADAQNRYLFLRDHAGVTSGSSLDKSSEQAARNGRPDPIRNGGPQGSTVTRPVLKN
jgi:hypothetical protein